MPLVGAFTSSVVERPLPVIDEDANHEQQSSIKSKQLLRAALIIINFYKIKLRLRLTSKINEKDRHFVFSPKQMQLTIFKKLIMVISLSIIKVRNKLCMCDVIVALKGTVIVKKLYVIY